MYGEHSHYEKYITRIVTKTNAEVGSASTAEPLKLYEVIQFICEEDGLIFKQVEIKQPKLD